MSLSQLHYRPLAQAAGNIIVGGTAKIAIVEAIIAQWTCEQPRGAWPPVHDNPGFVSINALRSVGIETGRKATTSPGVGFLAVFTSPLQGAEAYGGLIHRGARYAAARAYARAGNGDRYLTAVCNAGYGTQLHCCLAVYESLPGET